MTITVIVCTYNRCETLAATLEGIACSTLPVHEEWEVLVVDNNSSDRTRAVVEGFLCRYPGRFRYVFESQQGLSHARNAGIRESLGDILAFIDDDVIVTPTWLDYLTAPLREAQCSGVGGRILPKWNSPPPDWLPLNDSHLLGPFVIFDRGLEAGPLTQPPFGANMAFHKRMFARYGSFRIDLGRSGENMIGNEDTEFGMRLLKAGEVLRYESSAVVYHPVDNSRLQKKYLLKWWYGKGRSDIRQERYLANAKYFLRGVPITMCRGLVWNGLRWILTLDPQQRFQRKLYVWSRLGEIVECYQNSKCRRTGEEFASVVSARDK